jgi:hypothetical protein
VITYHIIFFLAECGDHVVDEDQKLINSRIDSDDEFIDSSCLLENFPRQDIAQFHVCFITGLPPKMGARENMHIFSVSLAYTDRNCSFGSIFDCRENQSYQL